MAIEWTTKEKLVLLSDILEFGDQPESWSSISNDLLRTFQTNTPLPQTKKDGRYAIKNCKHEYKQLIDHYKSEWIEHGSSNGLKLPLAKYIWIQLKSLYQNELTYQLNESRKKLTEFCLRLETAVNIKSNTIESTPPPSNIEIKTPLVVPQDNEQQEEKITPIETISQPIKSEADTPPSEPIQPPLHIETNTVQTIIDNVKEEILTPPLPPSDQPEIKEETQIDIPIEPIPDEIHHQPSPILSPNPKETQPVIEQVTSQQTPIDSSSSNILSDQQPSISQPTVSISPAISSINNPTVSESSSSSRSTSRTSSETKTDVVKIIPTTTPKYHVYFSPKNSINNNLGTNKTKPKRKAMDDIKDENENESTNQNEIPSSSSSSIEQTKILPATAPITRRSISTRSVPNTAVEQEEEKSRRFSAMLSENPNGWQSQSNAIIQFLLTHKQGYLFEHEITDEIAPKYHQFIRRPIALDTIRKTLESNQYQTKEYFKRDIYLMLYNAMKYNPRYHHVHRAAKHLFNITNPLFNLSAQEINGQISLKNNISLPTTTNDIPVAKRKRTK